MSPAEPDAAVPPSRFATTRLGSHRTPGTDRPENRAVVQGRAASTARSSSCALVRRQGGARAVRCVENCSTPQTQVVWYRAQTKLAALGSIDRRDGSDARLSAQLDEHLVRFVATRLRAGRGVSRHTRTACDPAGSATNHDRARLPSDWRDSARRHPFAMNCPLAEDSASETVRWRLEQPRCLAGSMLQIAVETRTCGDGPSSRREPRRTAPFALFGPRDRTSPRRARRAPPSGGRPSATITTCETMPGRPVTTSAWARFVERWNDRDGVHPRFPIRRAGSTSTDATASVKALTAETIPMERSGGYEELSSVP